MMVKESDPLPEDLKTLIRDVRTIKTILQGEDARLPQVWKILWSVASAVFILGMVQYFVPAVKALPFDEKVLYVWLPSVAFVFFLNLFLILPDVQKTGKAFMAQRRFREFFYSRFHLGIGVFVIGYLLSRSEAFALNGVFLVLISMIQTLISLIVPQFRWVPFVFLTVGLVELFLDWRGPEVTLFNIVLISTTLSTAGFLLKEQDNRAKAAEARNDETREEKDPS